MEKPYICIYHANCIDGFAAAWAVRAHAEASDTLDAWEFYPAVHGTEPPDVKGRQVIIVDFSYKLDVMRKMLDDATTVTIVDHHKTAEADLTVLFEEGKISGVFDTTKSGCMLTWEFLFGPDEPPPPIFFHIQDRDLWKFALGGTREIAAMIFSYDYDFAIWDRLVTADLNALRMSGGALERKHHKDIRELLSVCKYRMTIAGHDVPVANLPYTLSSDAGHEMAKGEKFAACYYDTPTGRCFSLRSADDGLDVSEIAAQYGGGGHKHAAGFSVSWAKMYELALTATTDLQRV